MSSTAKSVTLFLALSLCCGCGLFSKDTLVVKPGSPYLINDTNWLGTKFDVSVWSNEHGGLVEYGWVKTKDLKGWTVKDMDWSTVIGDGE